MGIIYSISVLILLISFVLVKKTEKKIDIINFICISIVALLSYNTFICFVLTFFTIPITLWLLTLINAVISVLFIALIIKNKQLQKYSFKKIDLLYIFLIAIVILAVSYLNFDFPFDVNYETGDPSVHYLTSLKFAESEALLPNIEYDEVYGDLSVRKPASYVNSGLLMKCLSKDVDSIECYNIFASFSIFTLLLTGITLYSALKNFSKSNEHNFFAFLVTLLCTLGYPLNSFLFGFEYLSLGLLILCSIIDLVYYYDNKLLEFPYLVTLLALLNFGLFFAYYMLIPFVYAALWIHFCISNYSDTKKIVTKKLVILLVITLLIPFILGYIYHLAPKLYAVVINKTVDVENVMNYSSYIVNEGLAVNGYIYINVYSNMLLLLPLTIYLFIKKVKDKEYKNDFFIFLLVLFVIIFIEILLIGNTFEKVSMYYISKNYFALWIILAFINYKALITIYDKNRWLSRLLIYIYIFLMIISTIFLNVKVEYRAKNIDENLISVMEIFGANKTILFNKPREYTQEELEILRYVRDNLDYNSKIEVIADENAYYWQYVLLRYINKEEFLREKSAGQRELKTKLVRLEEKINKVDYMVYFNRSEKYNELKDKLFENSEIIYENSAGGILKYKN